MKGYEIKFNVYADSQEEADRAAKALRGFVDDQAAKGVAVTASKIAGAVERWKGNIFVTSFFKQ